MVTMTAHEHDLSPVPATMTLPELLRRTASLDESAFGTHDCNGYCLRASDHGVPVAGDPVAHAHPDCAVHGDPHTFVPGGGADGAGRPFCDRCRAYENEHSGDTYLLPADAPRISR